MFQSQTELHERVTAYARAFARDFRRRDQARWLEIYLNGLLTANGRKTVETLARHAQWLNGLSVDDPAQALQNFINQSPWDERNVLRRYRQHVARHLGSPAGIFVIHEVGFPKQGRQSVGVLRQYCPELKRKLNCQIAVAVSYVSPAGVCPLALRLYLPRAWLSDPARLRAAGVPLQHSSGIGKAEIAVELLREVRADGMPGTLVLADGNYGSSAQLRSHLEQENLSYLLGVGEDHRVLPTESVRAADRFAKSKPPGCPLLIRELAHQVPQSSLSVHGVGRSGLRRCGWTSVWPELRPDQSPTPGTRSVMLLIQEDENGVASAFASLPTSLTCLEAVPIWQQRLQANSLYRRLRNELGLDHFEGRSWRGFHHHACLVMAAFGFLVNSSLGRPGNVGDRREQAHAVCGGG